MRAVNVHEDPLKQMLTTDAFRSDGKGAGGEVFSNSPKFTVREQRTLGSNPEGSLCIILTAC